MVEIADKLEGLEKEFRSHKDMTIAEIHQLQIKNTKIEGQVNGIEKSMEEVLENSRWMKRAWTKGVISLVVSVSSSVILGLGALIWFLITK